MSDGWQPIETAPKDQAIWGWVQDWSMQSVAWFADDRWWMPAMFRSRVAIPKPTHWRPLPPPPRHKTGTPPA